MPQETHEAGPAQPRIQPDSAWLTQPQVAFNSLKLDFRTSGDASDALARTASSVYDLLRTTYESGERELQLVEAQDFYAHPRLQFEVSRVR